MQVLLSFFSTVKEALSHFTVIPIQQLTPTTLNQLIVHMEDLKLPLFTMKSLNSIHGILLSSMEDSQKKESMQAMEKVLSLVSHLACFDMPERA